MPLKTHLDEQPTLNLTAMLDVMFLLIIFFVLGTRFLDDERQIGLQVPQVVDRGNLDAAAERKTINVYRDGTITLDQSPSRWTQLTARLAAARGRAKPGRAGPRRRPGRIPTGRRRAERLQTGRHQRSGHLRTFPSPEEVSHGRPSSRPPVEPG